MAWGRTDSNDQRPLRSAANEFDLWSRPSEKQPTLDERFAALQPREGQMTGLLGQPALLLSAPRYSHPTAQDARGVLNNRPHLGPGTHIVGSGLPCGRTKDLQLTKFSDLGLSAPILRALQSAGYDAPTAIQAQAIPIVLAGRDVLAIAQTGTGKTAAFALPILQRLDANC